MGAFVNFFAGLQELNEISVVIRLVLATVMGSVIGIERGASKQVAGMRTFALVCLGSALAQIIDIRCIMLYGSGDPVRLAQGVLSGIGFLGVGTIVVTGKSHVKGLTTAATLWTTAVLGISIGAGYIISAVVTFLLTMVVITFMAGISKRQDKFNRDLRIQMEVENSEGVKKVMNCIKEHGFKVCSMEKKRNGDYINLTIQLDLGVKLNHDKVMTELSGIEEVFFMEEILY